MKNYFIILLLLAISTAYTVNDTAKKFAEFYDQILTDQSAIKKINLFRPKIYIYTDFGGGTNGNNHLIDLQTSGEIASAAWKETLQQELYINDSAKPLSPIDAAIQLAATFPYKEPHEKIGIRTIVVHVVDPGVGNDLDKNNPEPRSMALRKDGVLFIGPDNGTLSFVFPPGSLANIWEINSEKLTALSGINTKVGGTFHGRDLFSEAAFRIGAGILSPDEIGFAYNTPELKKRFNSPVDLGSKAPIAFERVQTERFFYPREGALFENAFLLGTVQSSLYQEDKPVALTHSKKLFLPKETKDELIAILNNKNGNIFIGQNDGLGTSFFKGFSSEDIEVFTVSNRVFETIKKEENNEAVFALLKKQPLYREILHEIDFLGNPNEIDDLGRPKTLKAKIWVDLYGNIKTTVPSTFLDEVKNLNATVEIVLNGVKKNVIFADTFSEVPSDKLFIYNGSTGKVGLNPHRSIRYGEVASNGVYGKFAIDFFENEGTKPRSGDVIMLHFKYPDS